MRMVQHGHDVRHGQYTVSRFHIHTGDEKYLMTAKKVAKCFYRLCSAKRLDCSA